MWMGMCQSPTDGQRRSRYAISLMLLTHNVTMGCAATSTQEPSGHLKQMDTFGLERRWRARYLREGVHSSHQSFFFTQLCAFGQWDDEIRTEWYMRSFIFCIFSSFLALPHSLSLSLFPSRPPSLGLSSILSLHIINLY